MNTPKEPHRRQFVSFAFYHILPEWRRLPHDVRGEHRREFAEVLRRWNVSDTMKVLTYSLVGTRGDADLLLWRICYSLSCQQEMAADLLRTKLGGYLQIPFSYLGMTRRSEYVISDEHEPPHMSRGIVRPGCAKYLFLYPLVRTRAWYVLPFEDRQRMVQEVVQLGREYPGIHVHVVYSFGLDDQEFVIALESDEPESILERVMRVRDTESSPYVQRDSPMFTCVQASIEETLERIG